MGLRRKIALWICPELADLPYPAVIGGVKARFPSFEARGNDLRRLDQLYAAATGVELNRKNAPAYSGPMYEWRCSRRKVRASAVNAIERLRSGRSAGVHQMTHFTTLNYFSAIWPDRLEWPRSIPRPKPNKKEAA